MTTGPGSLGCDRQGLTWDNSSDDAKGDDSGDDDMRSDAEYTEVEDEKFYSLGFADARGTSAFI